MSLSGLFSHTNSPPLITAMGTAIVLGMPNLQLVSSSVTALKVANVTAFGINLVATSVPGRLDDQIMQGKTIKKDGDSKDQKANKEDASSLFGHSLLRPAGWAFAIWGPIFLGETVFVVAPFLEKTVSSAASLTQLSRYISHGTTRLGGHTSSTATKKRRLQF